MLGETAPSSAHVVTRHVQDDVDVRKKVTLSLLVFFSPLNEDRCSSPVDTVKNDGRASSSKAKAKKGKSSVLSKPESKAATVRWQQHWFFYII